MQKYATALISNLIMDLRRGAFSERGASTYLHHIVVSDEHGWRKPHPQIFTDALSVLGVRPEEALFVGDSPQDDP